MLPKHDIRDGKVFVVNAVRGGKEGDAVIVLACVNKVNFKLSSHQKKIFKVDKHIGIAIVGLIASAAFSHTTCDPSALATITPTSHRSLSAKLSFSLPIRLKSSLFTFSPH